MVSWTGKRLAVGLGMILLLAVGCQSTEGQTKHYSSEIDPDSSGITFPDERFYASKEGQSILAAATSVAISECASKRGVRVAASRTVGYSSLYAANYYFGVWTEGMAKRFAFVTPMTNADLKANGIAGSEALTPASASAEQPDTSDFKRVAAENSLLSDADHKVVDSCAKTALVERLDLAKLAPAGPWTQPLEQIRRGFPEDAKVKRVYSDFQSCAKDVGLSSMEKNTFGVVGEDDAKIDEQQIKLALKVVQCKSQVNAIKRLSTRMAELQSPVIDQYSSELAAQSERIAGAVKEARTVLDS